MSTASGVINADDGPLAQALDSFDQLTLQRDRQRRRVTEEENAVRRLEELLTEKQRESEQLAREADSRDTELVALERRVPALEDTHRGARRSLQMLTQMRDLLSKQLDSEKRKTEEMLMTLDVQLEEAAERWKRYEAVYLTMPAYQRKLEINALAAEERELNERKRQLETELKSRVSDRDFCVRLAECWTQARLLEGAIAGGGGSGGSGGQNPDGENISGACSQGFSTPRASHTPSPVSDMETGQEPVAAGGPAGDVERTPGSTGSPAGRGQRTPEGPPPPPAAGSGGQAWHPVGGGGVPAGPGWGAGTGPGTPQKWSQPPLQQGATSPQSPAQPARPGLQSSFHFGATSQPQQSPQSQPQSGRPPLPQQNTAPLQSQTQARPPPPTQTGPASQAGLATENTSWSSAGPRGPAPSPRRSGSFLIQMPSLYRPSRPRVAGASETQASHRPAVSVPPAPPPAQTPSQYWPPPPPPIHKPSQYRPPQPPPPPSAPLPQQQLVQQPSATAHMTTAQDVEMTDLQEVQRSPVQPRPGGQPRAEGAGSSPSQSGGRSSQQNSSPGGPSSGRQPAAAEERQPLPQTTPQRQPPASAAAAPRQGTTASVPPQDASRMLAGRQYWLPMPPETPPAPPVDERRSFVQQLRQSPEAVRRLPPSARAVAAPLESGLEHQFLRPAVPSPWQPAPAPAPAAAGSPQSIFDTPRRQVAEPASPQRPPAGSPNRDPPWPAPPSTPHPPAPAAPSEPATPVRPAAAAGDAPRSMTSIFASPEADVGQLDSTFSLFGGSAGKEASPQPPPSSMSLFGAGDVGGGDGDQGAEDFSFSFFGGSSRGADKETPSGGGGVFSFF